MESAAAKDVPRATDQGEECKYAVVWLRETVVDGDDVDGDNNGINYMC